MSKLVDITMLSPNHSGQRTSKIERITPHCVVGQLKADAIGKCFESKTKKASCNYGIGSDLKIVEVVKETNRSWCSSNATNDQKAVTIECASDKTEPYAMIEGVYNKLVDLCVDICERNKIKKLLWLGDKDKTLAYKVKDGEAVLTAHRWFAKKSCPGDWLYSRYGQLATDVTTRLNKGENKSQATIVAPSVNKSVEKAQNKAEGHSKGTVLTVSSKSGLNIRLGAGSTKNKEGSPLPYGTKVNWYGYYTIVNGEKWLLVSIGTRQGYCMSKFLA